ncbi:DUF192 domain-containing protein [Halorientalis salina]|uniref:DUF192 domain-containing protein n=1 Tax=Halorientalis salina TaxID=2932266 RepID=UPI002022ABD3|nr:DUF192 domain-containing protein [Halorientalis salina]
MRPKVITALVGVLVLVLAAVVIVQSGILAPPLDEGDYETGNVTLADANGTTLATVSVRIADTQQKRRVGLSRTASLDADEGMLFVHDREARHTYVMRNMSFPLDIVFVAGNGTITRIHHAETEPGERGDDLTGYTGRGKYVLEVQRGYTNRTGVDVGDTVAVPESAT